MSRTALGSQTAWPTDAQTFNEHGQSSTIFVRNLPFDVTDEQLVEYFQDVGPVKHGFVARNREDHASRGFGFVEFSVPTDATAAQEQLNGHHWKDRKLRIELAINKADANERLTVKKELLKDKMTKQRKERDEYHDAVRTELRKAKALVVEEKEKNVKQGQDEAKAEEEQQAPGSGCTMVIEGFTPDVPADRILASMRKVAVVESFVYPSPESIPTRYAARVTYPTSKDGKLAVKRFNGKEVRECLVTARLLDDKALRKASRVMARNVSPSADENEIRKLFEAFGTIVDFNWPMGAKYHQPFLFVNMETIVQADRVIKGVNGAKVKGRPLVVDWALSKDAYEHRKLLEEKLKEKQGILPGEEEKQEETTPEAEESEEKSKKTKSLKKAIESDSDSTSDNDSDSDDSNDSDSSDDDGEKEEDDAEQSEEEEEDVENEEDKEEDESEVDEDKDLAEETKMSDRNTKKKHQDENNTSSTWNVEAGSTIFIRNLSFDTTENDLFNKFSQYGRVRFARIVKDKLTGRSQGTAFVQYFQVEDARNVISQYAGQHDSEAERKAIFRKGKLVNMTKLSMEAIRLDSRDLILSVAVDREKAKELNEVGEKKRGDKKREHLAREGLILPGSKASEGVSDRDMKKRVKAWDDKKLKLKSPNFVCSDVRLAVMNLPKAWNESQIRSLFRNAVVNDYREKGKPIGDITIKQVKIVRDSEERDDKGVPKSRGFAFVEFDKHEHALHALRALNNNPNAFDNSERRPIVEFAMDDLRKLLMRDKFKKQNTEKQLRVNEIKKRAEERALQELAEGKGEKSEKSLTSVIMEAAKRREREKSSTKVDPSGASRDRKRVKR